MIASRDSRAFRSRLAVGALLLLVVPAIGGRRRGPAPVAAFRPIACAAERP